MVSRNWKNVVTHTIYLVNCSFLEWYKGVYTLRVFIDLYSLFSLKWGETASETEKCKINMVQCPTLIPKLTLLKQHNQLCSKRFNMLYLLFLHLFLHYALVVIFTSIGRTLQYLFKHVQKNI